MSIFEETVKLTRVDKRGRITLDAALAGEHIQIARTPDGGYLITKVRFTPASEIVNHNVPDETAVPVSS